VVLLPVTDHEPLPCEAFEYSVWLSNDADATEIAAPDAPDPSRWNPARLIRAFTQGWTRNPNATGAAEATRPDLDAWLHDNSAGEAVADALATVWALPCGLSFRYVAIQAGNYGNPGPECVFDSADDELDAAAGLNEDDTVICIDADEDGHRDATCGGDDCDDMDPAVHPGAFEPCDAVRDLDCQPAIACPTGTVCDAPSGLCIVRCFEGGCAAGFTCVEDRCLESACAALPEPCGRGTVCRGGVCVAPCDGAVCPEGQVCREGACIDPCLGVRCPTNQVCIAGRPGATTLCGPACTCTDLGTTSLCEMGSACDARPASDTFGLCVEPGCETLTCAADERCEAGACVAACSGVSCPLDQRCEAGVCVADPCARITCPAGRACREGACVDACTDVTCTPPLVCRSGGCVDPCAGVSCFAGQVCMNGACVAVDGGVVDAGPAADTGAQDPDAGSRDTGPRRSGVAEPGCGCRVAGATRGSGLRVLATLALLALVARARRSRHRSIRR
ncbi:MAG: hypothetical protein IT379_26980, partial [Deltaproteobacteria bacterium]|nr:hypothetical protein [Deltaproteobacteria bacterium]